MNHKLNASAPTTLIKGAIKSDGVLKMDHDGLSFTAYADKPVYGPYAWAFDDIESYKKVSIKIAGLIPMTNDGLEIHTTSGETYQFVIANPSAWIDSLSETE